MILKLLTSTPIVKSILPNNYCTVSSIEYNNVIFNDILNNGVLYNNTQE